MTNRLLARVVRAAAVTFEEALAFSAARGFVAGNPVRPEFFRTTREADDRFDSPPRRGTGSDLWRLSGRARDQRGHGGGSAAAGSRRARALRSPTRPGSAIWIWCATRARAGLEAGSRPSCTKWTGR